MPVEIGSAIIPPNRPALTQGGLRGIHLQTSDLTSGIVTDAHGLLFCASRSHERFHQLGASFIAQVWV
ncbi:hypothetical protein [Dankookia rubra]|uniref:hypothetical protein n=1 Tax=Dankookia rubra TaxID=1442381 RepID=UPI001878979A|nr:hypothetical protein [Dankookia rubra]